MNRKVICCVSCLLFDNARFWNYKQHYYSNLPLWVGFVDVERAGRNVQIEFFLETADARLGTGTREETE